MQNQKVAALRQQGQLQKYHTADDGGKSVGISVGASMVVASVAGLVNVLLTNPIW